jgi:hypothetical protein
MKNRTIVLIIIGCVMGFFALIGGIIALVFSATSGLTDSANEFFAAARKGDYEAAYALTSEDLKRDRTVDGLREFMQSNGLDKVVDTTWNSRSFENNSGSLKGSVETESGGTIPMTIELVKEGEAWKITYVNKARSGLESD